MPLEANLVDRLIDKVKQNVGRPGDTTLDDYVVEYLNNAIKKVCTEANFWFMHSSTTINYTVGNNTQVLPSDFKDEDSVWLQVTNGSITEWIELEYLEWEDVRREFDDTTQAEPTHYIIQQKNLILWPKPDKNYVVRLDYYQYLTDLTDPGGATNYLLTDYPDILEEYASYKAFRKLREFDDANVFERYFEKSLQKLKAANAERVLPDEFVLRLRTDVYGSGITKNKGRLG